MSVSAMSEEQVADFKARLEQAQAELKGLAVTRSAGEHSRTRLNGKASGVTLALSYLDEYK
jgi:hypothetical protein